MIGSIDFVAVADGDAIDARISLHRRTRALAAVIAEGLHMQAHLRKQRGDQFGTSDAALAASSVHAHFQRQVQTGRQRNMCSTGSDRIFHKISRLPAVLSGFKRNARNAD